MITKDMTTYIFCLHLNNAPSVRMVVSFWCVPTSGQQTFELYIHFYNNCFPGITLYSAGVCIYLMEVSLVPSPSYLRDGFSFKFSLFQKSCIPSWMFLSADGRRQLHIWQCPLC